MTDWQPIKTAPRDGTSILAIICGTHPNGKPYGPAIVYWCDESWCFRKQELEYPDPKWAERLTHWMPLPKPPMEKTND